MEVPVEVPRPDLDARGDLPQNLEEGDVQATDDAVSTFWHFLLKLDSEFAAAKISRNEGSTAVPCRRRSLRSWSRHAAAGDITAQFRSSTAESPIPTTLLGRGKQVLLLSSISSLL